MSHIPQVEQVVTPLAGASHILCSLQAAGGRVRAPADPAYPFRAVILECTEQGAWRIGCVFECQTAEVADEMAMEMCTEPYEAGVVAMHYYVGEALQ